MEIKVEDSIKKLNLSVRSTNALLKSGIKTIDQLLKSPEEKIKDIYGLGVKSLEEINTIKKSLKNFFMIEVGIIKEDETMSFINNDGIEYLDIKLEDLGLSKRSYNCLKRNRINYFSELIRLSDGELMSIRNFGVTSLEEITKLKNTIELSEIDKVQDQRENNETEVLDISNKQFIIKMGQALRLEAHKIFSIILDQHLEDLKIIKKPNDSIDNADLLTILFKIDVIKEKFKNLILNEINKANYGLYFEEIETLIPEEMRSKKHLDDVLNTLLVSDKIDFLYDDRLMVKRKSFKDAGKNLLNKREYNVLINRIEGKTLEEIGEIFDVTRERIRQIEAIAKRKLNISGVGFHEDLYKDIFLKYNLDKEDFYLALGNSEVYNYLNIRYDVKANEKENAEDILADKEIPLTVRKKFEKAIYKDYIKIGNSRVKKDRTELINYVLKNYARKEIHFDEFKKIYLNIVEDLGLENVGNIGLIDRGVENRLAGSNKVLWKFGKKLRYYNQENYDFTELLESLNLHKYKDIEYSTLKFLKLYPELMKTYDIQDEYELHNLLKKICNEDEYPHIKFNRMPNIEFGIADRENQVEELLFMLAPISYYKFADEYEREYGVAANTVLANYTKGIEKYLHDNEYVIDFPDIPEVTKNILVSKLNDEMYFIEDLIAEVRRIDPALERNKLNPRSIKSLGFINYESYVISDDYMSASQYFNHILTSKDMVDLDRLDSRIKQIQNFQSQLYKLKGEYEIIEYAPNKYINLDKLLNLGIDKSSLKKFTKSAIKFLGEGKYFTMSSLRDKGFSHPLDELGFEDWFYTSILIEDRESISYIRVGRNKIMLIGRYDFNFDEFIESIVYEQEDLYINIYDLDDLLRRKYKIFVEIYKLISIIKSSTMHYDAITETVYGDYEIYYEVI